MGRKKKKTASPFKDSENSASVPPRTPSSASSASRPAALQLLDVIAPPPVVDVLSLRFVPSSSTSSKRSDNLPQAFLSEQDATALDILSDEDVLLFACYNSAGDGASQAPLAITGVAVCRAHLSVSVRSPSRSEGKSLAVSAGTIRIAPSSVADALFPLLEEDNDDDSMIVVQSPTTTPALPILAPTTPVSAQSSFSFARGGGGEKLYVSPVSTTTPLTTPRSSPTKTSSSRRVVQTVQVVPLESTLGRFIAPSVCRQAARVCLELPESLKETKNVDNVLKRMVLAHTVGRHVQASERLRISFQGKPIELEIKAVDEAAAGICTTDELEADLGRLSVEDTASDLSCEEEALLKAVASSGNVKVYQVTYDTTIEFARDEIDAVLSSPSPKRQYVAGLSSVMQQVRSLLLPPLTKPELFSVGNLKPPRGVLLHGPGGVGKSSLALQIAAELESVAEVQYINCASLQSQTAIVGEAEGHLSRLFRPPAVGDKGKLLVFDDIHLICPKRGGFSAGTDRLTATLLALIDGISSSVDKPADGLVVNNVVILAITSNPSLLDPALRRPGRIDSEVEVPIPDDASTRAEILQFQLDDVGARIPDITDQDWMALGKLAKGFNGADCRLVVKEALRTSILHTPQLVAARAVDDSTKALEIDVSLDDLKTAIRHTKPSAIKSITVEIPKVHWTSIGGMDSVKKELREAIELPLTHSELFTKLRVPPPRGILLYGPPGCSKTLMARALATEGQMNFLAVKGPELLSKWLGESERALASLFRRARMASPSIIFFDEIDAIASKRGHGDSASSGRLLSQLLTELDGVNHTGSSAGKKTQRVVVVGATNRPDLLDSALTRPGRIDRMIYVGVPDSASRARIFELNLSDKSCGDDIDVPRLASNQVSEGFSGAEVVAICRDAALLALEESENLADDVAPKLYMRHLLRATESMQRQITPAMLDFYASYRGGSKLPS